VQPITLGSVLTEQELRAFVKCSQFFHYGGLVEETLVQSIVRKTVEYMLAFSIKEEISNPAITFQKALRRIWVAENIDEKYTPTELQEILRCCTYALNKVWKILDPTEFYTVSGALPHRMKVSKTPIDLHISGLMRRKKTKELILPFFTPYGLLHSAETDPVLHLQMQLISQLGVKHWARPTVTALVMHIADKGEVTILEVSDTSYTGEQLSSVNSLVQALESGYHYPITPCSYRCPFKTNCFPGRKDEFVRNRLHTSN
jgi:hypothetical protein